MRERVPRRWWLPHAWLAGGLAAGVLTSRLPVLRILAATVKVVQVGVGVAGAVTAVDRVLSEWRGERAA
jgi:hypothetical protein